MTQDEKLEALVRRAVENSLPWVIRDVPDAILYVHPKHPKKDDRGYIVRHMADAPLIVFNHDFARALFGEDTGYKFDDVIDFDTKKPTGKKMQPKFTYLRVNPHTGRPTREDSTEGLLFNNFQRHLALAVISEDPIDYMYKAVFGGDNV